jgi:hypothetical protein
LARGGEPVLALPGHNGRLRRHLRRPRRVVITLFFFFYPTAAAFILGAEYNKNG